MGGEEQDSLAIVGRHVEREASAVGSLHLDGGQLGAYHQLAIECHLIAQPTVVNTKVGIRIDHRSSLHLRTVDTVLTVFRITHLLQIVVLWQFGLAFAIAKASLQPVGYFVGLVVLIADGLIDSPLDGDVLLWLVAQGVTGHDGLIVVAAPALNHHQQVEALAVGLVGRFEIVVGMGDEPLQVTAEQQLGHHVTRIVRGFIGSSVAHGDGQVLGIGRRLEIESHLFKGLILKLASLDADGLLTIVMIVDKEETVSQGTAFPIDDYQVVDACGQLRLGDGHAATAGGVGLQLEKLLHDTTAEDSHAIFSGGQPLKHNVSHHLVTLFREMEGTASCLGLRQVEMIVLAQIGERGTQTLGVGGGHSKLSPTLVLGLDGKGSTVCLHLTSDVNLLAFLIEGFESHRTRFSHNQMTSLRIETNRQFFLEILFYTGLWTADDVLLGIVAQRVRPLVDGDHPGVDRAILTEEVAGHPAVVEQFVVLAPIGVLRDAEVHHPTGVGAQFIVAGIERVTQLEVAVAITLVSDDQVLTLDDKAVGRDELHIEDMAHISIAQVVGTYHIGLVPDGVALEVTGIVEVQIHLLLHGGVAQLGTDTVEGDLSLDAQYPRQ